VYFDSIYKPPAATNSRITAASAFRTSSPAVLVEQSRAAATSSTAPSRVSRNTRRDCRLQRVSLPIGEPRRRRRPLELVDLLDGNVAEVGERLVERAERRRFSDRLEPHVARVQKDDRRERPRVRPRSRQAPPARTRSRPVGGTRTSRPRLRRVPSPRASRRPERPTPSRLRPRHTRTASSRPQWDSTSTARHGSPARAR